MSMDWSRGDYHATDDPDAVDLTVVASYLAGDSYWAPGIPADTVARAVSNSLCLSVFDTDSAQVGFARVVTDRATFAYLCDVFVLPGHRGQGLGQWLARLAVDHPELAGIRWFLLGTVDAHEIYRRAGFRELAHPEYVMEIKHDPADLYRQNPPRR